MDDDVEKPDESDDVDELSDLEKDQISTTLSPSAKKEASNTAHLEEEWGIY